MRRLSITPSFPFSLFTTRSPYETSVPYADRSTRPRPLLHLEAKSQSLNFLPSLCLAFPFPFPLACFPLSRPEMVSLERIRAPSSSLHLHILLLLLILIVIILVVRNVGLIIRAGIGEDSEMKFEMRLVLNSLPLLSYPQKGAERGKDKLTNAAHNNPTTAAAPSAGAPSSYAASWPRHPSTPGVRSTPSSPCHYSPRRRRRTYSSPTMTSR